MVMNERKINIQLKKSTHNRLCDIGAKGQTFDDIVDRLLMNEENFFTHNMPVETPTGVEYIEIRVPRHIKKIVSTNIMGMEFKDALDALCEENGIEWDE